MNHKPNINDTDSSERATVNCPSCVNLSKEMERLKEKAGKVLWYIKYDSLRDGIGKAVKELEMEIALSDLSGTPSSKINQD